jgi:hypothetical protein
MGDRLGLATRGHLQAIRAFGEGKVTPVLAQQSIREMLRTGMSPADVLHNAQRAVREAGFTPPWGADADHLKTAEDLRRCAKSGFTMFTIDPSEHVNEKGLWLSGEELEREVGRTLREAEPAPQQTLTQLLANPFPPSYHPPKEFEYSEEALKRIIVVYYRACCFAAQMFQLAQQVWGGGDQARFDFEVSLDETETPTSPLAHAFVVRELRKRKVNVTSLAPRFVGEFFKGIDYRGNQQEFRRHLAEHVKLAKELGPYKLSVHSGSDKFSVFPILAEEARGILHLKTSGTSYLVGLSVVAQRSPGLFRKVVEVSGPGFLEGTKAYRTLASLEEFPALSQVGDRDLENAYLASDNNRQILHIGYGAVFAAPELRKQVIECLSKNADLYADLLCAHFLKHLRPFA